MRKSNQLLNRRDEVEIDVLDKISNRIGNWRRFGRIIGIEDHHLSNIEENFQRKYERVYRCILHKKQSSKDKVEWCFWRSKLLRLGEGSIVDIIETKYPYLSAQGEAEVTAEGTAEEIEIDVLDKISIRIGNWRRFGQTIGIEDHHLNNIEENFQKKKERVYRCILHKKQSSEEKVEWCFWRTMLLRLGEGSTIVDIIETKYPYLSAQGEAEVHKCIDEDEKLAIISHNACREENFLVLSYELEDKIELHFKNEIGRTKFVKREKLQEYLFKKHRLLLEFSKYSFSEKTKFDCNVLRTAHAWLKSNNDGGFAIKGYDLKHHLKQLTVEFNDESTYKDSYILVYSVKHNLILHIDTSPTDINSAIINNRTNIRYFRTLHQCLIGKAFLFLPVTLLDITTNNNVAPFSCESCEELGLLVPKVIFEELPKLDKWWQSIEINNTEIRQLVNLPNEIEDVKIEFLKSILGFMIGVTSFNYPVSTDNPQFKSSLENDNTASNLIMLHPNDHAINSFSEARL